MGKSLKKSFKRKDLAYLLKSLYFVSHLFSSEQYETYVHSTFLYITYSSDTLLDMDDDDSFSILFSLAYMYRSNYTEDERYNTILTKYYG